MRVLQAPVGLVESVGPKMRILERWDKVGNTKVQEQGEGIGDQGAVAVGGIGFEAEETHATGADHVRQRLQRRLGGLGLHMVVEDSPHFGVPARAGSGAAGGGGA
jgi:hypothetical protein